MNHSDAPIRIVQCAAEAVQAAVAEGAGGTAGRVDLDREPCSDPDHKPFSILDNNANATATAYTIAAAAWTSCKKGSVSAGKTGGG